MKKFGKLLYLGIMPLLLIGLDVSLYQAHKVDIVLESYTLLGMIAFFHIAGIFMMWTAYHIPVDMKWRNKKFKVEFEKAPGIGLWLGVDHGFMIVIPFCAIRFALVRKPTRDKQAVRYTMD